MRLNNKGAVEIGIYIWLILATFYLKGAEYLHKKSEYKKAIQAKIKISPVDKLTQQTLYTR